MESITSKTKIILLKRGGRIWVSNSQANVASEAKLSGEGVVDIDGQLIEVSEIRAIINADTYQTTQEKRLEDKKSEDYNLPAQKSDCHRCAGTRFVTESRNDPLYDKAAIPCPRCNPDPPKMKWAV